MNPHCRISRVRLKAWPLYIPQGWFWARPDSGWHWLHPEAYSREQMASGGM